MTRSIVLGGSGFIGSHVLEQLLLAGHQVSAPVRESSSTAFLDTTGATVTRIDFSDASLRQAIAGHDVVYNCLAEPKMHNSEAGMRAVEIALTRRVLHAAAAAGVKRFVQLSTIQVYGFDRPAEPIDENYPLKPAFRFSRVCAEREALVLREGRALGMPVAILRPVTVLGERDVQFKAIAKAHRQGVFMAIGKDVRFSAMDARDAGRAMVLLGDCPLDDNPVYLAKGFDTSWEAIKQALDQRRGKTAKVLRMPKPVAWLIGLASEALPYRMNPPLTRFSVAVLSTTTLFDNAKIRAAGFSPQHTLDEAMAFY